MHMRGAVLCFLCSLTALGQAPAAMAQAPYRDAVGAAIQAYWQARGDGRFEEAAAQRNLARSLVERLPAEAPQFASYVQQVAQLYQNAGMHVEARAVAEGALARAGGLGDAHPARIMLLNTLSDYWQQDRSLLKALPYLEKAVAALDSAPAADSAPGAGAAAAARPVRIVALSGPSVRFTGNVPAGENSYVYQRLASLYQQLGRPEAAAAVRAKIVARSQNNDAALASFYESEGKLDEAAAIYRKQADQAGTDPLVARAALQSLANVYMREERYADAVATMQQAIANCEASGVPNARIQAFWMRQSLAGMLAQAGQTEAADQVYRQLLADSEGGQDWTRINVVTSFANHLSTTKRGAQAESLLKDYLANHGDLDPMQQSNVLFSLANAARSSGDAKRAEEYQRAANEKQQAVRPAPPAGQILIGNDLQKAVSAANDQNIEEAFSRALAAMDAAPRASDREQVTWQVPQIAASLARNKASAKADQLYQRLFGLVEGWSAESLQPLGTVAQSHARYLMSQQDRWSEASQAIQRYRGVLVAMHGPETGWLDETLHMTIDLARASGRKQDALLAAQDLLTLAESHNGTTSEPHLRALDTMAEVCESTGDPEHALSLRRQTVGIADLVFPANDPRRGFTRSGVAFALARQKQFDEAERLINEAIAISQSLRPPQPKMFSGQLEEIRRMKSAPEPPKGARPAAGSFIVGGVGDHWFQAPAAPPPPPPKKQ